MKKHLPCSFAVQGEVQKNWVTRMPKPITVYVPRIVRPRPDLPKYTRVIILNGEPPTILGREVSCTYMKKTDKWRFVERLLC